LQPLVEREIQGAERVVEARITGRALPDHAANVQGAHEGVNADVKIARFAARKLPPGW
jgi:hypothetical protein